MRKNILALSMGALAAAVMLTGCFDGPSAPANEADTPELAVAAATVVKRVNVTFIVPKRTNNARNDGQVTAINRCRAALPRANQFVLLQSQPFGRTFWRQTWACVHVR
jgi:uncharacterized lipoprotein YajG